MTDRPISCPDCGRSTSPADQYCRRCGLPNAANEGSPEEGVARSQGLDQPTLAMVLAALILAMVAASLLRAPTVIVTMAPDLLAPVGLETTTPDQRIDGSGPIFDGAGAVDGRLVISTQGTLVVLDPAGGDLDLYAMERLVLAVTGLDLVVVDMEGNRYSDPLTLRVVPTADPGGPGRLVTELGTLAAPATHSVGSTDGHVVWLTVPVFDDDEQIQGFRRRLIRLVDGVTIDPDRYTGAEPVFRPGLGTVRWTGRKWLHLADGEPAFVSPRYSVIEHCVDVDPANCGLFWVDVDTGQRVDRSVAPWLTRETRRGSIHHVGLDATVVSWMEWSSGGVQRFYDVVRDRPVNLGADVEFFDPVASDVPWPLEMAPTTGDVFGDGRYLAAVSATGLVVVDLESNTEIASVDLDSVAGRPFSVRFVPN